MSRNEDKAGKTADLDFSALDRELAEMARETPDVPADFHGKWMQAVREEAANNPREKAASGREYAEQRKTDMRRQRRYILSAAAAFVVVIGGALLLKDQTNLLNRVATTPAPAVQEQAVSAGTPENGQEEPVPVPLEDEVTALAAVMNAPAAAPETVDAGSAGEAAEAPAFAAAGGSAGEASYSKTSYKESAARSDETDAAYETDSAYEEEAAYEAAETYEAEEAFYDPAEAGDPEPEATPVPEATPAPEPTPAPTAVPEPTETSVNQAEAPAAAAAAAQDPEEADSGEATSFLQRVWDFLLKITPWALGIIVAALFLITYVIRARQRKKNSENHR